MSGGLKIELGRRYRFSASHRLHSSEAGVMMPELGKRLTHDDGVELVRQWIASMPRSRPPASGR